VLIVLSEKKRKEKKKNLFVLVVRLTNGAPDYRPLL
jgi:hypothetical protein